LKKNARCLLNVQGAVIYGGDYDAYLPLPSLVMICSCFTQQEIVKFCFGFKISIHSMQHLIVEAKVEATVGRDALATQTWAFAIREPLISSNEFGASAAAETCAARAAASLQALSADPDPPESSVCRERLEVVGRPSM